MIYTQKSDNYDSRHHSVVITNIMQVQPVKHAHHCPFIFILYFVWYPFFSPFFAFLFKSDTLWLEAVRAVRCKYSAPPVQHAPNTCCDYGVKQTTTTTEIAF